MNPDKLIKVLCYLVALPFSSTLIYLLVKITPQIAIYTELLSDE